MKILFMLVGAGMMIASVFLGFYVALWVCLAGGFIDIVSSIVGAVVKDQAMQVTVIAWAFVKILFAGIFGWISFVILFLPGAGMFHAATTR